LLFVEEIQSDWHQQGRKHGYMDENTKITWDMAAEDLGYNPEERHMFSRELTDDIESHRIDLENGQEPESQDTILSVPDGPFKSTTAWMHLALKRILRDAVKEDKEYIAWANGRMLADQNAGYHSRHVPLKKNEFPVFARNDVSLGDSIQESLAEYLPQVYENSKMTHDNILAIRDAVVKQLKDDYYADIYQRNGSMGIDFIAKPLIFIDLEGDTQVVKDVTIRSQSSTDKGPKIHTVNFYTQPRGLNKRGRGLVYFYDKMVPKELKAVLKRHKVKVETKEIVTSNIQNLQAMPEGRLMQGQYLGEGEAYRPEIMDQVFANIGMPDEWADLINSAVANIEQGAEPGRVYTQEVFRGHEIGYIDPNEGAGGIENPIAFDRINVIRDDQGNYTFDLKLTQELPDELLGRSARDMERFYTETDSIGAIRMTPEIKDFIKKFGQTLFSAAPLILFEDMYEELSGTGN